LHRGLWLVIGFEGFGTFVFFGDEFNRGDEEIEEVVPLGGVQVVKQRDELGVFEAVIAEELSDMSPVFVFDMGIVVFVISPGACELHRGFSFRKKANQVPI